MQRVLAKLPKVGAPPWRAFFFSVTFCVFFFLLSTTRFGVQMSIRICTISEVWSPESGRLPKLQSPMRQDGAPNARGKRGETNRPKPSRFAPMVTEPWSDRPARARRRRVTGTPRCKEVPNGDGRQSLGQNCPDSTVSHGECRSV